MPHNHHYNLVQPRASPVVMVTSLVKITVTAPSLPPPTQRVENTALVPNPQETPSTPTPSYHAPSRHHRPSSVQSKPTPTPSYHAPERQHRPSHGQSSSAHKTKDHPKLDATSHKASQSTSNHRTASSSIQTSEAPAAHANKHTGTSHSFDEHDGSGNLQKSVNDTGMSAGAKAGLAIGLILAFALIGILIFLIYRRKKNQNAGHQQLDDEKSNHHKSNGSVSSQMSVSRTIANAPRLSLRPVTEMFPSMSEKQENTSASSLIATSAASVRTKATELSARQAPSNIQAPPDPFADNSEDSGHLVRPNAAVPKPLSIKSERTPGTDQVIPGGNESTLAFGPTPSNKRMSPPGPGPNNVHRVQLDFNPSMDDELGLRAGQLVRMLHEYDDGWALCIRLDRSQQGVVPRTCISKLPVKPRPQGPPPGVRGPSQGRPRGASNGASAARGPPPDARQRSTASPGGRFRSQSSDRQHTGPVSPASIAVHLPDGESSRGNIDPIPERRTTPSQNSESGSTPTSPTQGGAVPNRKPVPGQALSC